MKLYIFTFLLLISTNCHSNSMLDYLDVTDSLIQAGKYEEALERTIWFHNHSLELQKNIAGVRLSFALSYWYEFGKKYPPALAALKEIRTNKTNLLLAGDGFYSLFDDVASINKVLSENHKTLDLFKKLEQQQPILAKNYWYIVKDIAISENDYTLLKKYTINTLREYSDAEELLKYNLNMFKDDYEFIEMNKNIFVERSLELIKLSLTLNDSKTALLIKNKANALVKDERLDNVLLKK